MRSAAVILLSALGLVACERSPSAVTDADSARGPEILRQHACHACHRIPGVVGPDVAVGPPLDNVGNIKYIAGVLPSTPENLVRWIRHPQQIDPLTAMPDLGVSEEHARAIAAYLYAVSE